MQYKHFSIEERERIQELLWRKTSIRSIAKILDRSPSSISREITRNSSLQLNKYTPRVANDRALIKRKSRGRTERLKNDHIRKYVIDHLKRRWSPEQIAGRMRKELNEKISHEAIYQYIYTQIYRDGYGYLRPNCEDLRMYLRRKRKRRIPKGARRCQRIKYSSHSIDMRPKIIDKRTRIGDWEGDSVESINHKPGINTVVERKSGLALITRLKDKTAEATVLAMQKRFENIPNNLKLTITLDNGPENGDWQAIEERIGLKCYYANAYHSWERGTNENTNGLIRDYFPKKTDFDMISDKEILFVENELNNRPRKRLGWKTPLEVFSVALGG